MSNLPKEDEETSFTIYPLISIGDIATLQKEALGLGYNLLAYPVDGHYWACVAAEEFPRRCIVNLIHVCIGNGGRGTAATQSSAGIWKCKTAATPGEDKYLEMMASTFKLLKEEAWVMAKMAAALAGELQAKSQSAQARDEEQRVGVIHYRDPGGRFDEKSRTRFIAIWWRWGDSQEGATQLSRESLWIASARIYGSTLLESTPGPPPLESTGGCCSRLQGLSLLLPAWATIATALPSPE